MKFIISIDDDRFARFMQRAIEAFGEDPWFTRINLTPDDVTVPDWWEAAPDRWAVTQAIRVALVTALENGEDCELFEDDCVFCEDFTQRRTDFLSKLPDDWDMAYLGGQLLATELYPPMLIDDKIVLAKNVHRNHAWICRHRSIQRLVDWLDEPQWSNSHTSDWRIGYLQLKPDFHTYIPKEGWLCGQGENHSLLDSRDYPDRWWHYTEPEFSNERKLWDEFSQNKKETDTQDMALYI